MEKIAPTGLADATGKLSMPEGPSGVKAPPLRG
jgi:hypothetical protein